VGVGPGATTLVRSHLRVRDGRLAALAGWVRRPYQRVASPACGNSPPCGGRWNSSPRFCGSW